MKISVIGAGNVGSLTALRLAHEGLGEVFLIDVVKGVAQGKAFDLEDARPIVNHHYLVHGTDDISQIKDSDIIVMTAGFPRKPGMTREELLLKNAMIIKDVCSQITKLAKNAIVVIVTNPLDLMTYYALKITGFNSRRMFGMGVTLDAARFANLISKELNVPITDIRATVIGTHGEAMLPLPGFTTIKGVTLDKMVDEAKAKDLVKRTVLRGLEIVTLLGSGSAYFAPSAAIAEIVRAIAKDEKKTLGVSAYLNGEYGIKDICIGVPCRIGKNGIEQIIELQLSAQEKEKLSACALSLQTLASGLPY